MLLIIPTFLEFSHTNTNFLTESESVFPDDKILLTLFHPNNTSSGTCSPGIVNHGHGKTHSISENNKEMYFPRIDITVTWMNKN